MGSEDGSQALTRRALLFPGHLGSAGHQLCPNPNWDRRKAGESRQVKSDNGRFDEIWFVGPGKSQGVDLPDRRRERLGYRTISTRPVRGRDHWERGLGRLQSFLPIRTVGPKFAGFRVSLTSRSYNHPQLGDPTCFHFQARRSTKTRKQAPFTSACRQIMETQKTLRGNGVPNLDWVMPLSIILTPLNAGWRRGASRVGLPASAPRLLSCRLRERGGA